MRLLGTVCAGALMLACGTGSAPAPTPAKPPAVPLVALFDDGFLYGVAADGRVFSGDDLRHEEPSLRGARSISGFPDGWSILGSPPDDYECAALPSGDVLCRGSNVNGDLDPIASSSCDNPNNACDPKDTYCFRIFGPTSYPCVRAWTAVPGVRDLAQLHRTCGIDASGTLVCWGRARAGLQPPRPIKRLAGDFAILDDRSLYDRNASALVDGLANVVDAAGSTKSTACAVESDDSLWCWGDNLFGAVGDGTTTARSAPTKVGDGFVSVRLSSGLLTTACGVMRDGGASCWGLSSFDADGGAPGSACASGTCVIAPTRVAGATGVLQVVPLDIGEALTLVADGRVLRWSSLYASPSSTVMHPVGP